MKTSRQVKPKEQLFLYEKWRILSCVQDLAYACFQVPVEEMRAKQQTYMLVHHHHVCSCVSQQQRRSMEREESTAWGDKAKKDHRVPISKSNGFEVCSFTYFCLQRHKTQKNWGRDTFLKNYFVLTSSMLSVLVRKRITYFRLWWWLLEILNYHFPVIVTMGFSRIKW